MDRTLVIVPCGQGKIWDAEPGRGPTAARDAYTGSPFKVHRAYAERFADRWVILSAKYGFIDPEWPIPENYNVTFKRLSTGPVDGASLQQQVRDLQLDQFPVVIGLGGKEYRQMIDNAFGTATQVRFPFAGLPIGKGMQAVKQAIARGAPVPR